MSDIEDRIAEVLRTHYFEMLRNGSGDGECAPFPLDAPVCGWTGHISDHPAHVAERVAALFTEETRWEKDEQAWVKTYRPVGVGV